MSWDSYCTNLTATNFVAKAAICGLDASIWAQTPGFNIKPEEVKKLVEGLKNADGLRQNGIHVGGIKYFFLQAEEGEIQGKKEQTGISIAKAGKCMVIGMYDAGKQPGNCRIQVDRIRTYLVGAGY